MEEHTYNGKVAQNDVENGNSKSTFKNKNKKGLRFGDFILVRMVIAISNPSYRNVELQT